MEYAVVFHAFLYAAALHLLVASDGRQDIPSDAMLRLAHYSQTIKLVNKHIQDINGPPSDALLMAVTTLAVHGSPDARKREEIHPRSPLAEEQYLHVYGRIMHAKQHIPALAALLARKGGLAAMNTYGMAETIQL